MAFPPAAGQPPRADEHALYRRPDQTRRTAQNQARSGCLSIYLDQPARTARHFRPALRLAPFDPAAFNSMMGLGVAQYMPSDHAQGPCCTDQQADAVGSTCAGRGSEKTRSRFCGAAWLACGAMDR